MEVQLTRAPKCGAPVHLAQLADVRGRDEDLCCSLGFRVQGSGFRV